MDRAKSLANAVEGILDSYTRHGNINHLEATALPSKSRVAQLLDQLMDLVFSTSSHRRTWWASAALGCSATCP
jgi:hypothetical protein